MPRYLGLDVGERRIGLALSDSTGSVATPLEAIGRRSTREAVAAVAAVARRHGAAALVVGLPLSEDGSVGPQARRVLAFCRALREGSGLPVDTQDERYTTSEAERRLREAGVQPSRERGRVDALAASIILQEYLDALRGGLP